jgi:hypothetical protein
MKYISAAWHLLFVQEQMVAMQEKVLAALIDAYSFVSFNN